MEGRFDICHANTAKWEGGWSNHSSRPRRQGNVQACFAIEAGIAAAITDGTITTSADYSHHPR